jgi:hypothetical protein
MPLTGAGTQVNVDFTAKADQLIAEVKRVNQSFDSFAAENQKVRDEMRQQNDATKKAGISITDFRSAYQIAMDVVRGGEQIWKATTGAAIEYADQIRQLDQINGQSAESNSRLFQVLDDYKVSYNDILTATKKLKDEGLTPTIDTVAKLAEQYQAIQDPAEKLAFAQKNLGKSTKDWLEVLNQSPEILRKQAAGVNENLILSEKMIEETRLQEIAVDSLQDTWKGYLYQLGEKGLPTTREFTDGLNVTIRALEIGTSKVYLATHRWGDFGDATEQAIKEVAQGEHDMLATAKATDTLSDYTEALTEKQQKEAEMAKLLSGEFTGLLSSMSSIQKASDDYQNTTEDIAKSDQELTDKKTHLNLEWGKTVRAGKDTAEAYKEYMAALADVSKAEQDNADKKAQLEEDTKKATQQRKYDLVEQKLAVDGVSTKEFNYLENLKVKYGLVSEAAANQAIAENQAADELVSGFEQTLPLEEQSLQVMQQIAAFDGTMVNFGVNFTSNMPGSSSSFSALPEFHPNLTSYSGNEGFNTNIHSMDSGGAGIAGTPYMIGTGAQPEVFVPHTNGTFIPNGKGMGDTYNITINNPVPTKSEDSIRQQLRKMAIVGAGARTQ